jgi:hypothetical protein
MTKGRQIKYLYALVSSRLGGRSHQPALCALEKIGKKGVVGKDCTQIVSPSLDKFSPTLYIDEVLFHHVFDCSVRGASRFDKSKRDG